MQTADLNRDTSWSLTEEDTGVSALMADVGVRGFFGISLSVSDNMYSYCSSSNFYYSRCISTALNT